MRSDRSTFGESAGATFSTRASSKHGEHRDREGNLRSELGEHANLSKAKLGEAEVAVVRQEEGDQLKHPAPNAISALRNLRDVRSH